MFQETIAWRANADIPGTANFVGIVSERGYDVTLIHSKSGDGDSVSSRHRAFADLVGNQPTLGRRSETCVCSNRT